MVGSLNLLQSNRCRRNSGQENVGLSLATEHLNIPFTGCEFSAQCKRNFVCMEGTCTCIDAVNDTSCKEEDKRPRGRSELEFYNLIANTLSSCSALTTDLFECATEFHLLVRTFLTSRTFRTFLTVKFVCI